MTHQNIFPLQHAEKAHRFAVLTAIAAGVVVTLLCGSAQADWAEQMSEGSGVDRGAMLSAAVSGGQSQQNLDAPALREAMANSITNDLAATLGSGAVPEAYSVPVFVVPGIAACEEDCEEPDELA